MKPIKNPRKYVELLKRRATQDYERAETLWKRWREAQGDFLFNYSKDVRMTADPLSVEKTQRLRLGQKITFHGVVTGMEFTDEHRTQCKVVFMVKEVRVHDMP